MSKKQNNKRNISEVDENVEENWELNNAINNNAFAEAFSNLGERINFIENLYSYYEARKAIFMLVDRKFLKDKDYENFKEIREWRDNTLGRPKKGNTSSFSIILNDINDELLQENMERNYYDASVEEKKSPFHEYCENCHSPKPNDFCTFCKKEEILLCLSEQSQRQMQFCKKYNSLSSSNYCISCNNKLYKEKDFDKLEESSQSSIIIINDESIVMQEQATSLQNRGIFDSVIQKYSYTPLQVGYVNNNEIFWSDNELSIDDSSNSDCSVIYINRTSKKRKLAPTLEQEIVSLVNNEVQEINGVDSRSSSSTQRIDSTKCFYLKYDALGGKGKIGENNLEALKREIFEEGGIEIDNSKLLKIWKYTCSSREEYIATPCNFNEVLYKVTLELFIYPFDQPLINLEKDKHTE
ncbi:17748_t:CDS:2 [Dentiscutata erythropus]|uniref:17748_t:CDS:1 n=1 Tax=Dentiscutata erythropus TaxID=1348616 RepID=A0A9N8ZWX3_9GLOM|nr:17748_t:CDS:2 [Dentiscutata erythropus]